MRTTYIICNSCGVSGNVSESMTSDELNSNGESILEKYKNRQYSMHMGHYTYCDLIHINSHNGLHYCINCMRRDFEMSVKSLNKN